MVAMVQFTFFVIETFDLATKDINLLVDLKHSSHMSQSSRICMLDLLNDMNNVTVSMMDHEYRWINLAIIPPGSCYIFMLLHD